MVALPCAYVLAVAECKDLGQAAKKTLLGDGATYIAKRAGEEVTNGIVPMNVDFGHDLSQRNGFAFIAATDLTPSFVVIVENGGGGDVGYAKATFPKSAGKVHILKPGKCFVETVRGPRGTAKRRVGVVTEKGSLMLAIAKRGKILIENAVLAEFRVGAALLTAVGHGHLFMAKGQEQIPEPMRISGHAMTADEDQKVAARGVATDVERTSEGKLLTPYVNNSAVEACSYGEGIVG